MISAMKYSFQLIYVESIFYHNFLSPDWQISCHLYHFYLFAFRYAHCRMVSTSLEMWLPTRPLYSPIYLPC